MTKAAAALAAALLALDALAQPCSADEYPPGYPPKNTAWIVAPGYSGYSGYPWPGPPWAWPLLPPKRGCYDFRQHLRGAWRRVVICE